MLDIVGSDLLLSAALTRSYRHQPTAVYVTQSSSGPVEQPHEQYTQSLLLLDRLHRLMLELVGIELDRLGIQDLNGLQALLLHKIGDKEILTIGELSSRGHYGVFKTVYNIRKLVKFGYILYKPLKADRRAVCISLTIKGRKARQIVTQLYQRQLQSLEGVGGISGDDLEHVIRSLEKLELFWINQIRFRL